MAGDADEAEGDGPGEMRPVLAQRAQCKIPVSILSAVFCILYLVLGALFLYYPIFFSFQILCVSISIYICSCINLFILSFSQITCICICIHFYTISFIRYFVVVFVSFLYSLYFVFVLFYSLFTLLQILCGRPFG